MALGFGLSALLTLTSLNPKIGSQNSDKPGDFSVRRVRDLGLLFPVGFRASDVKYLSHKP